jgi:adenylate cyclase
MKRTVVITSVSLGAFALVMLLELFRPFAYQQLRDVALDTLTRSGRTTPANADLVFLAIDSASATLDETDIKELYGLTEDDSTEARALRMMSRDFPWSREVYAMIIDRLVNAGAKVVLFDLLFPAPSANDEPFRLALDRYGAHVVIGTNFTDGNARGFAETGASHTPPVDTLIPHSAPIDTRLGYVNVWPDATGVVRRAQYRVTFEQVDRRPSPPGAEQFLSLVGRGLTKAGYADAVPRGLDSQLFRFTGAPRVGFPPRSVFEIFVPDYWRQNYGNGEFFRGKIVLIGAEGNWHQDEHQTPFGTMPGPEIHLNAMNAALHNEFIRELPFSGVALLVLLAAVISVALSLGIQSPWLRLLALLVLDFGAAGVALLLFNRGTYLPIVAPLAQLNVAVFLGLISDVAWERIERNRVRRTLERYVSTNVVRELLDRPKAVRAITRRRRKTGRDSVFGHPWLLHGQCAKRPAGARRPAQRISQRDGRLRLPPRRHARQVHRRCGHGCVGERAQRWRAKRRGKRRARGARHAYRARAAQR